MITTTLPTITFSRYGDEDTLVGVLRDLPGWTMTITAKGEDFMGEPCGIVNDAVGDPYLRLALHDDPETVVEIRALDISHVEIA